MKILVVIFLTGILVWFLAPQLPAPSEIFHSSPSSEETIAVQPKEPNFDLIENDVFQLINAERRSRGLDKLNWDEELHIMAREHSEWMAITGNFEHSEYNLWENCWWGIGISNSTLAQSCFNTWKKSNNHYENMMEPAIRYCSIGFAQSDNGIFATFLAK